MKNLNITVAGKVADFCKRDGFIVCGNTGYQITFAFDSEWDDYAWKTARFIWNGGYVEIDFVGNDCIVPTITNATEVLVGVYVKTDDGVLLSTTTAAVIPCYRSILCETSTTVREPESMETWRDAAANSAREAASSAQDAYNFATEATQSAQEAAESVSKYEALKEWLNTLRKYIKGEVSTVSGTGTPSANSTMDGYPVTITLHLPPVTDYETITDIKLTSYAGAFKTKPSMVVSGNKITVSGYTNTAVLMVTVEVSYTIQPKEWE